MKNRAIGCLLVGSLFLGLTGCSNEEGGNVLKGKTFEATQNGANDYLLTFRDDGTLQVKENGNLGRTDEGTYKVADKKTKEGYYKVTFDNLTKNAGYVDESEAGYWLLEENKNNELILLAVGNDCSMVDLHKTGKDRGKCIDRILSKEKDKKGYSELDNKKDVHLKEKK